MRTNVKAIIDIAAYAYSYVRVHIARSKNSLNAF